MKKEADQPSPLELFAGGVPPLAMLDVNVWYLNQIIESCADGDDEHTLADAAADVALIALLAHFEAFCADTFAAAINIAPQVLSEFADKRKQDTVLLRDLVRVDFDTTRAMGFLIAEHRDFGDLKAVNSLFFDLLGITPFSTKEIDKLSELLDVRNLLVHHGGVYTSDYAKRHGLPNSEKFELFHHGPEFGVKEFEGARDFIVMLAKKLTTACRSKLDAIAKASIPDIEPFRKEALALFTDDPVEMTDEVAKLIERDFD